MKQFKGTPGPWNAGTEVPIKAIFCERAGMSIVFTNSWREEAEIEAQSNVHLIVAAPDLLEALQNSKSLLESIGMQSSDEYQQASAAIRKALGEE